MKNIQVIDGAENATFDVFAASEDEFLFIFPNDGQDIEFIEDVYDRLGNEKAATVFISLWKRRVDKKTVDGIHGTLFCGLRNRRKFYPTKREDEMIANPP